MATETKGKVDYTDEPLGDVRIINDFLPSPENLAFKESNVKITITLSKASVDFFKNEAKKHHTKYQKMIRRLLDVYAEHHM
jgi:predicted DNA binding CopG/RHH family protein